MYDYSTYNSYMGLNNNVASPAFNSTNTLTNKKNIGTIPGINAPKKNNTGKQIAGVLVGLAAATAAIIVGVKAHKAGGISKIFANAKKAFTSKAGKEAGEKATKTGIFSKISTKAKGAKKAVTDFLGSKFGKKAGNETADVIEDVVEDSTKKLKVVDRASTPKVKKATFNKVSKTTDNLVSENEQEMIRYFHKGMDEDTVSFSSQAKKAVESAKKPLVSENATKTVTQNSTKAAAKEVSKEDQSVIRYFHKDIDEDSAKYAEELSKAKTPKQTKAPKAVAQKTIKGVAVPSEANIKAQENLAKMQEAVAAQQEAINKAVKPLDEMQAKAESLLNGNKQ